MSEKENKAFLEFETYWRLSEDMLDKASKEDLAETVRILAMQSAHYARKFGELELPDLTELLATVDLDDDRIEFLRDGSMALVGVLGNVMYGDLDEGIPKLH